MQWGNGKVKLCDASMTFLSFFMAILWAVRGLSELCSALLSFYLRQERSITSRRGTGCAGKIVVFFPPTHCNPSPTCVGEPIMPARDLSAGVKEVVKLFKNIIFLNSPYHNISWMRSTSTSPICGGSAMVSVNIISTRSPIKLGPIQQPEPLKEKK